MSLIVESESENHKNNQSLAGSTSLVIIQATPFCNINCRYCYLPQRSDRTKLSLEQLRLIFERLFSFPCLQQEVTIVWHAGEPLVLGTDYYEAAFRCAREVAPDHVRVKHSFQTNGLLLSNDWCRLIRKWKVGVGISIDGPAHVHDAARKTRRGDGTHAKALAGLQLLQKKRIPFYVISVLSDVALEHPDAMFDFYKSNGIADVGFNIEEAEGDHKVSTLTDAHATKFRAFLDRFSERMLADHYFITVRELESAVAGIQGYGEEPPLSNEAIPFGIVTIDVKGNVYTFSPELAGYSAGTFSTFAIGNIFKDSFSQMLASPVLENMSRDISRGIEMCRQECSYYSVCGGGSPANKIFENGSFASTTTAVCTLGRKAVADFVLSRIEASRGRAV